MFKLQVKQIFTEGLGDIFFMKFYRFLCAKVSNKYVRNVLASLYAVIYLAFLIAVGFILFKINYPL